MLTVYTEQLLSRLRSGTFDPADLEVLERTPLRDVRADLDAVYPLIFQERRLGGKTEIGMAHSLRLEFAAYAKRFLVPIWFMVPVYRGCIFLSAEGDRVTGISVATGLRVRPTRTPTRGIALTVGRGFKLDHSLDGWDLKPLARRTIKLTDEFLQKRGWRFDSIQNFMAKS